MEAEQLMTPAQAAKMLNVSVRLLRQHVRAGEISYVVIGMGSKYKRRRFASSDIARFQDRHRETSCYANAHSGSASARVGFGTTGSRS